MDCRMPGFISFIISWSLLKRMSIQSVMLSNHLILSPRSLPALNLSQHQGLFQWVGSSHQVAKVLELQHQSFQWIFRVDFLVFWFDFTGLISLQSKGLSRVFSSTTIRKHLVTQPSLWSKSIYDYWRNHSFDWLYGPLLAKWCLCFLICDLGLS